MLTLSDRLTGNAVTLEKELSWLASIIEARVTANKADDLSLNGSEGIWTEPPALDPEESMYAGFIHHYQMDVEERLVALLALVPHVRPQLLDVFYQVNPSLQRGVTEFGGIQGKQHGGFLPTGETAIFLLAGRSLQRRWECQRVFDRDHFFARHHILWLEPVPVGEPRLSGQLVLAEEMIDFLTNGEMRKPDYSRDFPASLLTTDMEWDELVLPPHTLEQLKELEAWTQYEQILMHDWGLSRRLRPGYRCLFYGPPGTGKTLAATLLGKLVGRDVYRVSLSAVVSKYIGETEKNLERIFERAENMNCLLFFDEADALFGKRTNVSDAHDRYANQEVSYLLQRIEDFPGVVILTSNYSSNIDEAFTRRFQAVVPFPMPNVADRARLWQASFSDQCQLPETVSIQDIAQQYELSGGGIMNVVRYASLMALASNSDVIQQQDIIQGIVREIQKEGKTL